MQEKTQAMRVRGLTIAHTTDLRDEESAAFAHAVALALQSGSKLVSLHANDDEAAEARMPQAVTLLKRWKALPNEAVAGDEQKLGMLHERLLDNCCDDPVDTLVRAVKNAQPQLVISATHGREGLARTMFGSVAEAVALHVAVPMLLMPVDCHAFVSEETGRITLQRILVAAGDPVAAEAGVLHALWLADLAGTSELDIELLHVNDGAAAPSPRLPERRGVRFHVESVDGPVEAALRQRAQAARADVVVMATRGHDSLRDLLLGSHAERVSRRAPCPILHIPLT